MELGGGENLRRKTERPAADVIKPPNQPPPQAIPYPRSFSPASAFVVSSPQLSIQSAPGLTGACEAGPDIPRASGFLHYISPSPVPWNYPIVSMGHRPALPASSTRPSRTRMCRVAVILFCSPLNPDWVFDISLVTVPDSRHRGICGTRMMPHLHARSRPPSVSFVDPPSCHRDPPGCTLRM